MKVRQREPFKTLLASGFRIFDLYDLMDRAGTVTFRFTKRYITIPLTAAATGLLGNRVGGDAFDWERLIYTPLIITLGICLLGLALKVPNMLSSAKRTYARLLGHINMVQLKRNRRRRHGQVLWNRHFVYHTRENSTPEQIEAAEIRYLENRKQVVDELEAGLSETAVDHLELENLDGDDRREALENLELAMEYVTPTSPGVETCESAFFRTLMYSLRSDAAQRETQERCGYNFSEYKSWLRQTFFDASFPPLAYHVKTDFHLRVIRDQLNEDGVHHEAQVRQNWYVLPGLAQRFWHANTIRKVNLKVGEALSRLSRKYRMHLTVQAILWPGNHDRQVFKVKAPDGRELGEELRVAARRIIRRVYGQRIESARLMLDRAMLNNFMQTMGLRVLADYGYCSGDGLDQNYLDDLEALGCSGSLLESHRHFVAQAREAMQAFETWLAERRPQILEDPVRLAVARDAFLRNWHGLRERIGEDVCPFNLGWTFKRFFLLLRRPPRESFEALVDRATAEDGVRRFREERDALRMHDALAHLEYDTYLDLILSLGDYEEDEAELVPERD